MLPVAKDTATSGGTPPKAAAQETVRSTPSGTTPVPAGESVPTSTRSRAPALCGERDDLTACLDVAVVDHLYGGFGLVDDPCDIFSGGAVGPPLTCAATSGRTARTKSAPMTPLPGIDAPPVWTTTFMP